MTLTNGTLSLGSATALGDPGNVLTINGGGLRLGAVTVANNISNTSAFPLDFPLAAGIQIVDGSTVTLHNTIVAGNSNGTGPDDIRGAVAPASSHNLIGENSHLTGIANGAVEQPFHGLPRIGAGNDDQQHYRAGEQK